MAISRTLDHWLSLLETRHPSTIELGLDRVAAVWQRMGAHCLAPCVIVVAGTNGKGSTIACIDALLRAQGKRTGVYTSPHLVHFQERIQIHAVPVDERSLCDAFEQVEAACGDTSLTYFEFTTLAAFRLFSMAALDVAILEVGLGGRLDAVNCIDADVAVVTRIAFDHQDWLGDSLDKIAFEKAGIFRSGKPAVCGQASPPATLMQRANELGAHWVCRGPDFDARDTGETWQWQGAGHTMEALPALQIPRDSAVTALQVMALLECLPSAECVRSVLASLAVPGRFQRMQLDGIPVILDVAHNPDAATWLASRLRAEPCRGRTFMVFAALADKDIAGVVEPLIGLADAWFVADLPDVPRAASAEVLMERIAAAGPRAISVSKNLRQALARVRSLAGADDRIVVFGSFYTVGKVLALLERC